MKRTMKFLASVFILLALTACSGLLAHSEPQFEEFGLDENRRFIETRSITVLVWERANERMPDFTQSHWAEWVRQTILEEHNIDVTFVSIARWDEERQLSILFAGGDTPDVAFTFYSELVDTFSELGAITDLKPLLDRYKNALPNLYNVLTPTNIYWNLRDGELYSMLSVNLDISHRMNTFVREDWLETLGLLPPTNIDEFETMLIAFRDNADILLGDDAHMMIPYRLTSDIGWSGDPVITSFIPNDITDRQWYVYGFDDRRFTMPNIKEGVRVLNSWFNQGLLWDEFALHGSDSPLPNDLIHLGFVGSFSCHWDMPFRAEYGLITEMRENVGLQANFIVVHPFQNDAGTVRMQVPSPSRQQTSRKLFIPSSSTEPLAALLYFDFISRLDVLKYLQLGYDGIHHLRHDDGTIELLPECPMFIAHSTPNPAREHIWPDHLFMPSRHNFDFTPTVIGFDLGDPIMTAAIMAYQSFPGITPEAIAAARATGERYAWHGRVTDLGRIEAEVGMRPPLAYIRDGVLRHAVVATVENFDYVFDNSMDFYMRAGGNAIVRERQRLWVETFGDVDNVMDGKGFERIING